MKLTLTTLTLLVTLAVHSQTYSLLMTNSSGVASNSITVPTPTATFISPTGQALTNTFSINTTSLIDQMA
jgi:hypothetical protein